MADHIIAIDTYGSHRITDPQQRGQVISAYKQGYTNATTALLLELHGVKARDVSPKQASYRYVHIDGDVVVRSGYILLVLTADELARAERVTRAHHRAGAFVWRDKRWLEFPNKRQADYANGLSGSSPNFDPTGFRPVSPSTGEREAAIEGIRAEKSQHDPNGKPWWWLTGDTYPHRDLLKRHGARFSGKRRAWYWIGSELPTAIRQLVTQESEPAIASEDDAQGQPLAIIFGEGLLGKQRADNGDLIVQGENRVLATRTNWLNHDDQPEVVWLFDLPNSADDQRRQSLHRALKSAGARYSPSSCHWYFDQLEKVAALDGLAATVPFDDEALLPGSDETEAEDVGALPADEKPPAIRVIKPIAFPTNGEPLDTIQTAIRDAKKQPSPARHHDTVVRNSARAARIGQTFCGELTGSITGQVFCYGYAVHEGICVYVNMGGPRTGVEAIRAKLSKGDMVTVVPDDAPAVELTAGEGNSGQYSDHLHTISEARFTSLILLHDWVVHPNYGGAATTFLFRVSEHQARTKLKHHVTQLVNIPVFDAWTDYLWTAGQAGMLVRPTRSAGGVDLLTVTLDATAWTRLITGAIEQQVIALPEID